MIVEPVELAHSPAQPVLSGQAARPARAAQGEDAQPLRERAHGAARDGLDDEAAHDASLLLALEERKQRDAIVWLGHGRPPARPGARYSPARPSLGSRSKPLSTRNLRRGGQHMGGISSCDRNERLEGTLGIFWRFPNNGTLSRRFAGSRSTSRRGTR